MLLIVSFGALAGLYVLLDAPFTAVTQIIIYAGAIMVLFLFVVMLLNAPRKTTCRHGRARAAARCSSARCCRCCSASSRLGAVAARASLRSAPIRRRSRDQLGAEIGVALFTTHSFAFEVTSILILVAMVGAVVIARKGASMTMVPL